MGNLTAAAAYFFGWIGGIIVYLMANDDKDAKFHGLQSILFNIAFFVVTMVLMVVAIVLGIVLAIVGAAMNLGGLAAILMLLPYGLILIYMLAVFVLWLMAMYKAYKGERYHLPIVGGLAEKWA